MKELVLPQNDAPKFSLKSFCYTYLIRKGSSDLIGLLEFPTLFSGYHTLNKHPQVAPIENVWGDLTHALLFGRFDTLKFSAMEFFWDLLDCDELYFFVQA